VEGKDQILQAERVTPNLNRRALLKGTAAAFMFSLAGGRRAAAQVSGPADRIWTGGTILTMNDAAMRVEAVAEKAGRIIGVGTVAEITALKGPETRVIDLSGRTMVPGFVDPHGHIVLGGLQALSANMLPAPDGPGNSIPALQQALREWMTANAEAVAKTNLIVGFGYDNAQLVELRHPTRDDLDAVSTEYPVILVHQSGHLAAMNSKGLELAGVTAETPDPPGGVIRRREGSQEPDGVLEETAMAANVVPLLGGIGADGFKELARSGAALWARFGYTTAQEGRTVPPIAKLMREVADAGGFANDVTVYIDVDVDLDYILANRSLDYVNHMRIAGGKLSLDGSPQGFTALRDRPYYDPVGNYPAGYKGYATVAEDRANELVDWAFANNVHLLTHSNGEGASDMLIAAIRAAEAAHGVADRRPVLIHGQFLREDQVDAYIALKVVPSLFPMHTYYWGDWHRDHTVGPVAADNISPTGWFRDRGSIFTTHHDAPVAFPDSMRVLDATVTRRTRSNDILGPAQRVDVITGLKAMTIWAAYQQFEEGNKGSIEVGKLADLVILSDDPTAVPPDDIDLIKVTETIKEGATIFALTDAEIKKGEMMLPGGTADTPFQRFLVKASLYHDSAESGHLPVSGSEADASAMSNGPPDGGCVTRLFDDAFAKMQL
jgi:predicted amidohydrolase YtcJ